MLYGYTGNGGQITLDDNTVIGIGNNVIWIYFQQKMVILVN